MKVNATYVSVWDGGTEIRTSCVFNTETKEVEEVDSTDEGIEDLDICDEEYVELPNGDIVKDFTNDGSTYVNGQRED